MLQCTKVCWKITCVSLGEFIGPMQEMGMKFKHLGVVAWPGTLRNLVFKFLEIQNSPENHETWHGVILWHQHAVVKKLATFAQVFGYKLLANRRFLSRRLVVLEGGRVTFVCETIYAASHPWFFYRSNIELYEYRAKFWNYSGFVWPFYTLIEFLGI